MEIYRINCNTTFCNHVSGNRTVNSTRKKKCSFTIGSNRHSSRSFNKFRINVNFIAYLNIKLYIGLVNIHRGIRAGIKNLFTDISINFH